MTHLSTAIQLSGLGVPGREIHNLKHPEYTNCQDNWFKWRLTYEGGYNFIHQYLKKYSMREDDAQFRDRREITYIPAFATAALTDIKNAIFQRTNDVTRTNGSTNYQQAMTGLLNGVDLLGSSMNSFVGCKVLPELLSMSKVGVYVDMPFIDGNQSKLNARNKHPYYYVYKVEDICSWAYDDTDKPNEYVSLLLRDCEYELDPVTNLPVKDIESYRHLYIENDRVHIQFYNEKGVKVGGAIPLDIDRIPFHIFDIGRSLLEYTADYQIALMNLASADLGYSLLANYPFYTEQFDQRSESPHLKQGGLGQLVDEDGATTGNAPGSAADAASKSPEIKVGPTQGRRYPMGVERPNFINPSSEPLSISMEKEEQMKREIRELVNISLSNIGSSAASKQMDQRGLEGGLSFIGLVLENGERQLARFWSMYEGTKEEPTVSYPEKYSLKSDEDRRKDAEALIKDMASVPSNTYKKELSKRLAEIHLGDKVSRQTLEKIYNEIDAAETIVDSSENLIQDVINSLVDPETASLLKGYPKGSAKKAEEFHAKRMALIAKSQSIGAANGAGARGVKDFDPSPGTSGRDEKTASRDKTTKTNMSDPVRGKGK